MLKSPIPCEKPAMTKTEAKPVAEMVNELFSKSPDGLRELVGTVMQEMLEAKMTDTLGAERIRRLALLSAMSPRGWRLDVPWSRTLKAVPPHVVAHVKAPNPRISKSGLVNRPGFAGGCFV
jgi:hypothetical protein